MVDVDGTTTIRFCAWGGRTSRSSAQVHNKIRKQSKVLLRRMCHKSGLRVVVFSGRIPAENTLPLVNSINEMRLDRPAGPRLRINYGQRPGSLGNASMIPFFAVKKALYVAKG